MVSKFVTIDEIRNALTAIGPPTRADELLNNVDVASILDRLIGSSLELNGILLVVEKLCPLNDIDPEIWRLYQRILNCSTSKYECALVIAKVSSIIPRNIGLLSKYNIVRLVYVCLNELVSANLVGHSNVRISCARILVEIDRIEDASLVLRDLAYILSEPKELEKEYSFVANNQDFLLDLRLPDQDKALRESAESVLVESGLA